MPKSNKRKIKRLERKLERYRRKEEQTLQEKAQTPELDPAYHDASNPIEDLDGEALIHDLSDEIDNEVLVAIGESSSSDKQYGEKVHEEICNSIQNILVEGFPKQSKEKLLESFIVPCNCKLLEAPKLNLEISSVLNNSARTRDKLLQERQHEMGLAIASVCQAVNYLFKKEYDKLSVIKKLSDTSRLLSSLHFQYTEIRRRLCNPFLDRGLAERLKDNKRDEYLYTNLDDTVKSFSAMKRASNVMKPKQVTHTKPTQPKNFQNPHRRPTYSQAPPGRALSRGGAHQRYQPRQPFRAQDHRQFGTIRGRPKYP